ncbi:MAG: MXAN_6577-like cysteine-rich protein [Myxococcota bacterium]|nr:MXAN_6577-like cysteine-rich protein [Myxococcota bacterium]
MTRKLWMSLLVASVVALSGCDGGGGVPDGGLVQPDGARLCTGGETRCDGTCVDTSRDEDHCGACGNVCGTAEACVEGACALVCPSGQEACEDRCADLDTDEQNCGACGETCGQGETCVAGSCSVVCPESQTECGGACVDTGSDPSNCGACGTSCEAGEVCDMGTCALTCSFGLTECEGACVDLDNNPANCGACGFTCDAPDGAIGLCASRRCRTACDGAFADCNADLGEASGDGCEIDTATDPDNCGACGIVCEAENAIAGCAASSCTIAMCDAGFGDCDMDFSNGCELPLLDDDMNCGACGNVCPAGEGCNSGTCTTPVAEDCATAVALSMGPNTIDWFASTNDYLTSAPSCTSTSRAGPDLVFSYTATMDESIELVFDKPTSTRWVSVVSTAACGTVTPELACISDFSPATMSGIFRLSAGETAYIYLADTTSGTNPLDDPLTVTVNTTACASAPPPAITSLSPTDGATDVGYFAQELEVVFDAPIVETTGVVTLTDSGGGTIDFDLATSPDVSFDSSSTTLTIDTTTQLTPGETYTVSWTGVQAVICDVPVPSPTWSFTTAASSCGGTGPCGDSCGNEIVLTTGANTARWFATTNDYLTTRPSCATASSDGPDVVFSYTAAADEVVDISFDKPTSTRWAASVSASCGMPTPELACASEFSASTMDLSSFSLRTGETAYVYLVDTTSGSNPLDNPVTVNVTTTACSSVPSPVVTMVSPPDMGSAPTLSPSLEVTFDSAVSESVGTISLSGSGGTSVTYDLSMGPPEVTFNTASTVMTVAPTPFMPGETVTVTVSGMESQTCFAPVATETWSFTVPNPSCAPGMGGMVGTTETRIPTGLGSFTEYWVVADDIPTGWIYFGGTGDFYRVPKAGGPVEDVEALAGLTTSQLGYEAVIVGAEIYAIESTTTGTMGHVWRISTDGGLTWLVEDYATFPMAPNDDFRGATAIPSLGRIFLVTDESSTATGTEIWSVPIGMSAPQTATLELTVPGVANCTGIARDNTYYYLACGTGERLGRVPVGGGAFEDITTMFDMSSTTNDVYGEDLDMDGTFDVLYVQSWYEEIYYVCDPATATPFADLMVDVGGSSSNYGMGFDGDSSLYLVDDDNREIIVVQ